MPELPDIVVYAEALAERIDGQLLTGIRLLNMVRNRRWVEL